ncbi:TPA: hypothetical protein ACRTTK_003088 [Aeromonas hydrophila]
MPEPRSRGGFVQDEKGRFQTDGLNEKQFIRVFNEIRKINTERRRDGKRTLRPGQLSRKSVQDLVRLGKKQDGTEFTVDDLKRFDKLRKQYKKRGGGLPGVTYAELVAKSAESRVDRASNRSKDRRGVSQAQLLKLRANVATIKVKASDISDHQHHKVDIRFEEWDGQMGDADGSDRGYAKAARKACAGRMSINCSCGDHQYRYRYMATLGNYCLSPPKEFAYPKITNPNLTGLACKHVLLAATMLQSVTWSSRLGLEMARQARRNGYGDDRYTSTVFTGPDARKLAMNRKKSIDQDKAKAAFQKYQKRLLNVAKRIKGGDKDIEKLRSQLQKARKSNKASAQQLRKVEDENRMLQQQAKELMRDKIRYQYQAFEDAFKVAGLPPAKALDAFSKQHKIPTDILKELMKP